MIISYIQTDTVKLVKVVSAEISSFITNIVDYTGLELIANITCCNTSINSGVINTTNIVDDTQSIYVSSVDSCLYIKPTFLGLSDLVDAIYNLEIKLIEDGYTQISNCAFLDITYKCKVGGLLKWLIEENDDNSTEKVSTIAHILHYSLFNVSNCGCNCGELCNIFKELTDILNITLQDNDCGCK